MSEKQIKVEIYLTPDEFQLLELAAKHYGNNVGPHVDRPVSSQAAIYIRERLTKIIEAIE